MVPACTSSPPATPSIGSPLARPRVSGMTSRVLLIVAFWGFPRSFSPFALRSDLPFFIVLQILTRS